MNGLMKKIPDIVSRLKKAIVLPMALLSFGSAQGQPDVIPSSVDLRLVPGADSAHLVMQIKVHGTAGFGGILSALTATIRYDASSGAALGVPASFCTAWSSFTPSPTVVNNGTAYRTYNGFGLSRLDDPPQDGGCGLVLPLETWFTVATIPMTGGSCTAFILGNDAYTQQTNRSYYISMNGHDVTGVVTSGPVNAGPCTEDCLGVPGGTALPGTPCDDGNPNTTGETWTVDCQCVDQSCTPPSISTTSSNSPVCSGNALQLSVSATGTGPLFHAWSGTGSFSPNPNAPNVAVTGAASGNYQVTVSNACGYASAVVPVTVTPAPSATIAYTGSPYCTGSGTATVTRTGTGGGTYSASPSGLAINANTGTINLGNSTAGTYTVTYTIAAGGGCSAFSTTATVVLGNAPSATIAYAGSPYCTGSGTATVTRTGTGGGTYSASPAGLVVNSNTGTINLVTSAAGVYTVAYVIAAGNGCAGFSTTTSVTLYNVGDPCDDGDPATVNDTITAACTCEGLIQVGIATHGGGATEPLLYPNPNGIGVLYVDAGSWVERGGPMELEIRDVTGRLVYRAAVTLGTEGQAGPVALPAGMVRGTYLARLGSGDRFLVQRLVVQ